jgi:U3 small nucleolar ribonucleoprotein component
MKMNEYKEKKLGFNATEELDKDKEEIGGLFKDLFHKLDSLSNFYVVPKPVSSEAKVRNPFKNL